MQKSLDELWSAYTLQCRNSQHHWKVLHHFWKGSGGFPITRGNSPLENGNPNPEWRFSYIKKKFVTPSGYLMEIPSKTGNLSHWSPSSVPRLQKDSSVPKDNSLTMNGSFPTIMGNYPVSPENLSTLRRTLSSIKNMRESSIKKGISSLWLVISLCLTVEGNFPHHCEIFSHQIKSEHRCCKSKIKFTIPS